MTPRRGQFGGDCFHCHGGPLFQSQSFANNGLDTVFTDPGRHLVTRKEGDRGKFAVPSLRNIAVTAPYMHDGRFATLEEVMDHYASGVKRSSTPFTLGSLACGMLRDSRRTASSSAPRP